jgi:tRNA(Ile)-lysidine synthase
MIQKIINFCDKYDMLPSGSRILAAVSGGKDSVFLLHFLSSLRAQRSLELFCAHFNHRLRGAESDRDEEFVKALCEKLEVPCLTGSADVRALAFEKGLGIEEAAREARYAFLEETADKIGAVRILTAHTADDNAETFLLNLTRGSGLRGLCAIPPRRNRISRPLLDTPYAPIKAYLDAHELPHVEDSTNELNNCTRNRVRHEIVPELRKLNPKFDFHAAECISSLREDEEFLQSLACAFIRAHSSENSLPIKEFLSLSKPVSIRVLRQMAGKNLTREHLNSVLEIAASPNPHASADLPGLRVFRDYEKLVFERVKRRNNAEKPQITKQIGENYFGENSSYFKPKPGEIALNSEGNFELSEWGAMVTIRFVSGCLEINNSVNTFFLRRDSIKGNLRLRSRAAGDELRINGRNVTKTLKKLYSENKLNGQGRDFVPVIADDFGVVAVYGFGISERCAPSIGDDVISINLEMRERSKNEG